MFGAMKLISTLLVLAACSNADAPTAAPPPAPASPQPRYSLTENLYFAKPGMADDVWRIRNHVCDVLVAQGFPRGTVLRGPGGDGPDVIWQSAMYPSLEVLATEGRKMGENPAVKEAMKEMADKTRRFERRRYEVARFDIEDDPSNPKPWGFVQK